MSEPKFDVVGKCAACGGPIVRQVSSEYHGDPMHLIMGPGSKNQMTTLVHLWCDDCGIAYHKEPTHD